MFPKILFFLCFLNPFFYTIKAKISHQKLKRGVHRIDFLFFIDEFFFLFPKLLTCDLFRFFLCWHPVRIAKDSVRKKQ